MADVSELYTSYEKLAHLYGYDFNMRESNIFLSQERPHGRHLNILFPEQPDLLVNYSAKVTLGIQPDDERLILDEYRVFLSELFSLVRKADCVLDNLGLHHEGFFHKNSLAHSIGLTYEGLAMQDSVHLFRSGADVAERIVRGLHLVLD